MVHHRGNIAFFGTYRPPVPLDLFSLPIDPPPSCAKDELLLTDDKSYNQNGNPIPAAALKELLTFLAEKNPALASQCGATPEDAANGLVTGLVFVSERDGGLETLHVALTTTTGVDGEANGKANRRAKVKVLSLGDIYGADTFGGVRMEDSGCIAGGFTLPGGATAGHSLVYVSTKEPAKERRTPWTAVYKTELATGETVRLTPACQYDLSPAVSPSGKLVAVANFAENKWDGEIEKLKTNIVVMDVYGQGRKVLIEDAGWPSWGSDDVIFFHRGCDTTPPTKSATWAVFRYDVAARREERVTPVGINAMTPAAISDTKVAVATVREKSDQVEMHVDREPDQYRHIEIFDTTLGQEDSVWITRRTRPYGDHYNPFVLDGGARIGYHRCRTDKLRVQIGGGAGAGSEKSTPSVCIDRKFDKVQPPAALSDAGLYRVTGVFPSVSKNGKKLAFVDNEFQAVWLAVAGETRPRVIYKAKSGKSVFSTSWNQNDDLDTLYVCEGPAFNIKEPVQILRIPSVCSRRENHDEILEAEALTKEPYNCAFPSTNAEGTKLVFRGSRVPGGDRRQYKNLFVIDAVKGESAGVVQLTDGAWTDTHCSWSPRKGCDWIVFSSTMDKPKGAPELDHELDPGYFAVYLVSAKDASPGVVPTPVRVIRSAPTIAGHVNHPVFSPDMRCIVFSADLAAVSADPISMPHFTHSVRPYGDIFVVHLKDTAEITKNRDIEEFERVTHSRYEYSTPTWSCRFLDAGDKDEDPNGRWRLPECHGLAPRCPYAHGEANEKEGWHMTGHLPIARRAC